jgi:hypothetical protein
MRNMKISGLFILGILFFHGLTSQAQSLATSMERYRKLCLNGKISGDAYMTLLFTAISMAAAEHEKKLKEKVADSLITEEQMGTAFNLLFLKQNPSEIEIKSATETILMSLGYKKDEVLKIGSDIQQLGATFNENAAILTNPEFLGSAMSYLALRTEGMSNADMLAYTAGSGTLNDLTGDAVVAADFAVAAVQFIGSAVKEQQEINALYRLKRDFFNQYCLKLSDYGPERNKLLYPDVQIDSSNWKIYFNPIDAYRADVGRKASLRNYKTEPHQDGIMLSWKANEKLDKRTLGSVQDSVIFTSLFSNDLKFDFSRDFEFHMTVASDQPIGAIVILKIADNYEVSYTPVLTAAYSDVTIYGGYKYNPINGLMECGIGAMVPKKFHPNDKNQKELVLKKVGNKLISYWINDKQKVCDSEITTFFNRDSFKVTFIGDTYFKGDQMLIKHISLKYL